MSFEILTKAPVQMQVGARIDYRLRLRGIPIRWQSEITVWEPPRRFVDEQRRGPYRVWRHEHTFAERDGGTLVGDRVEYETPGGPLVHRFLVRPDLVKVFAYRQERFKELFADWSSACYLSGLGITADERFNYASIDLRGDFDTLSVIKNDLSVFEIAGDVKSMGPEFIQFSIPSGISLSVTIDCTNVGRMNAVIIRLD